MSIQAANAVALPYLSPCMVERAFESLPARNGAGGPTLFSRSHGPLGSSCDCGDLLQAECQ